MKNWQQIRAGWRKQAEKYASKRHPEKCTCFVGAEQCGEWCLWHDEVGRYMKAMEDHADVILTNRTAWADRNSGQPDF